jgi:NADPH:quinone reductase-like Zn-dependent oxidoreductase
MKAWRIVAGSQIDGLKLVEEKARKLGAHDVRLRPLAASLNFRDMMIVNGWYPLVGKDPIIPGSDAAGEVVETGSAVARFRVGDRVATSFFPDWIEGRATRAKLATALGGGSEGVLAQELVLNENALVRSPAHLDFAQAATLSCAGVTAWNALFVGGQTKPGDTVLLLGTGGVSIWALQLAKAAGARVIITSSSDEKLARARTLGADDTINYRTTPDWDNEVLRLTDGIGADLVVEVGGSKTVAKSVSSSRLGGTVAIIGAVSGPGAALEPMSLIASSTRLQGIYVGSRQMHEDLARFVEVAGIRPVVDSVFPFEELPQACHHFSGGEHFGKVVVSINP